MANTHNLFLKFESELEIEEQKEKRMMASRDVLKERITAFFRKNHPEYVPVYYIQGSYKMRNTIQTKDDLCDIDLGVHFERVPDVTGTQLQLWVLEAVKGATEQQEHRNKCIRVIYKADYNIDLPVYAEDRSGMPVLAVKNKDYEESDPRGFTDWYRDEKTDQSHRSSKYLKAWGDNVRNDMLSGLVMTLLSVRERSTVPDRDDISLYNTMVKIKNSLSYSWNVSMPVRPHDNVVAKHGEAFRKNFFIALDAFIRDAKEAVETNSVSLASKLWRKHLGSRFPLVEDSGSKAAGYLSGVAAGGVKPYIES